MIAVDSEHSQMEHLLARALLHGPGAQANDLIDDLRRQVKERTGAAVNYEVSLLDKDHDHLMHTVAPRLALFLREKRLGPRSRSVFLSIFWQDVLYFVAAPDFFDHVRGVLGLDEEAFSAVLQSWERTGRAAAGLLPAGGD